MGNQANVTISFSRKYELEFILRSGISCGWKIGSYGHILYLAPSESDDYVWQSANVEDFDLKEYFSCLGTDAHKLGLEIMLDSENMIGCDIVIFQDSIWFNPSINVVYLFDHIINFSWYLKFLKPFISLFAINSIVCSQNM